MQITYYPISKRESGSAISATFLQEKDLSSPKFEGLKKKYGALVENELGEHKFEAKDGQVLVLPKFDGAGYLIGVGVGELKSHDQLRNAIGTLLITAKELSGKELDITIPADILEIIGTEKVIEVLEETTCLAGYDFSEYREAKPAKLTKLDVYLEVDEISAEHKKTAKMARATAVGANLTRDLVNATANHMTPTRLADVAEEIAAESDSMSIEVHNADWAKEQGMDSYLAVDQGSVEPAKFIHIKYQPAGAKKKIALVGKGVTFDSGGLSLKPSNHMDTMKCDMGGAATVLGVFKALAANEPNVEVHGYIAATENMPSGTAIRPGDVITAANGKTIEILNTDAEGRLTLADALWYAQKENPDHIVDLATLTGACVVALGEKIAGIMSDDDDLVSELRASAKESAEELWQLPLHVDYAKGLKSDISDLRNISKGSYGGAITAGLFLKEFVEEGQSWAHVDIAGPAFVSAPLTNYIGKGGTGYGVRMLSKWIEDKE